jgi:hypothetical protein
MFILLATGSRRTWPILVLALALTVFFPNGTIDRLGPLSFFPEIKALAVIPLLLALAVGLSHGTGASRVIRQNARTRAARAASYGVTLCGGGLILALGGALAADTEGFAAAARNLLWLSAVALLTATLVGLLYTWLPLVLAYCAALLSPVTGSPWTPYGALLRGEARPGEIAVAGLILCAAVALALWDPRSSEYRGGSQAPPPSRPEAPSLRGRRVTSSAVRLSGRR